MIARLKTLQGGKGQFSSNRELTARLETDKALRKEIDTLSRAFLNKPVSGCSNCYSDAYLELITLSIDKAMEKAACQFALRRGKLLRDVVNLDVSLNMTQANITNELALYHLKTNPQCVDFFEKLPEDWQSQVEAYTIPGKNKEKPARNKKNTK